MSCSYAAKLLLTGLDAEVALRVRAELGIERQDFEDGEIICHVGDKADRVWVIEAGRVDIVAQAGAEKTITQRVQGEILGEQGILDHDSGRTAKVIAREHVAVSTIRTDSLKTVSGEIRAILYENIARQISRKLAEATKQRAELVIEGEESRSLLKRLANPDGIDQLRGSDRLRMDDYDNISAIVLFSDLKGFSAISQSEPPKTVGDLIKHAMSCQIEEIERCDGYVDKLMGDGIMAYWLIRAKDDNVESNMATSAIEAAEAARNRVRALSTPDGNGRLDLRIGLHMGEARRGNFGSEERWAFTLIGDTVNTTARLEQAKSDDQGRAIHDIRISDTLIQVAPATIRARYTRRSRIKVKETDLRIFSGPDE